jgi:hypothetical protein
MRHTLIEGVLGLGPNLLYNSPIQAGAVVMTAAQGDPPEWKQHIRDKDAEEELLDRFRGPAYRSSSSSSTASCRPAPTHRFCI